MAFAFEYEPELFEFPDLPNALVNPSRLALVALLAKALQRPEAEGVPIAVMIHDMVGNHGRRDLSALVAQPAQRLGPQLVRPHVFPDLQPVKFAPGKLASRIRELGGHGVRLHCNGGSRSVSRRPSR